ncbi:MAG: hypothetical protein ABEJ57_05320 [Halobacteriaceae archaeon]
MMNIDELRSVQSRERSTSDLQELRDSFYADVAEYVTELRAERDRVAAEREDPYDDEVIRLTDEIRTTEQVVESVYERRVGKIVKRASFAANDMGEEPSGLTEEERALYTDIVDRIEANKETVLDVVTGDAGRDDAQPIPHDSPTDTDDARDPEPAPEPEPETEDDPEDRATVRITEDVGEIYGVDDRVYTLETDDVVTLPRENAGPLLERDAAESLE